MPAASAWVLPVVAAACTLPIKLVQPRANAEAYFTNLKDGDEVAQGAMDVAVAGFKGVANLGYIVPALQPYAQTAGMLMFMSPWLRNIVPAYVEGRKPLPQLSDPALVPTPDDNTTKPGRFCDSLPSP